VPTKVEVISPSPGLFPQERGTLKEVQEKFSCRDIP
jgi:hypothetical protein